MRSWPTLALLGALAATCSHPPAPARPDDPGETSPASGCSEVLATIPYSMQRDRPRGTGNLLLDSHLVLEEEDRRALVVWIERLRSDPELRIQLGLHMDPATRAEVPAEVVTERLRTFGTDLLGRLRPHVDPPSRVALVIHGTPGAPPDDPKEGSWLTISRLCPPLPPDRDQDGLSDAGDPCPDEPEDHDQFEDGDGCPDRDNDGDGVLDAHTWTGTRWTNCDGVLVDGVVRDCRNQPEDMDGDLDEDGCPDICFSDCGMFRFSLSYDPATLAFSEDDFTRLQAERERVDRLLDDNASFFVEGHAARDKDPRRARKLAQRAADKVRDELVRRGFKHQRLEPISWGDEKPIARDTPATHQQNYRVDITASFRCGPPPPTGRLCP